MKVVVKLSLLRSVSRLHSAGDSLDVVVESEVYGSASEQIDVTRRKVVTPILYSLLELLGGHLIGLALFSLDAFHSFSLCSGANTSGQSCSSNALHVLSCNSSQGFVGHESSPYPEVRKDAADGAGRRPCGHASGRKVEVVDNHLPLDNSKSLWAA